MKRAVLIGGSRGAAPVLRELLASLPAQFPAPVLVVLHRHPTAREGLAEMLRGQTALSVYDAESGQELEASSVYLAPANYHLLVERDLTLSLCAGDRVHFARPAIDVTFESAVDVFGAGLVAVLLSGDNRDGANGLAKVEAAGGVAVVQAPESADAPSIPSAGLAATSSAQSVAPSELAPLIARLCKARYEKNVV